MDNFYIWFPVGLVIMLSTHFIVTWCKVRRARKKAALIAPVVVVSEQHTNAGPYPVTVQNHNISVTSSAYPMPQQQQMGAMPMPGGYAPYPNNAPYPTNTPYPMGMPQPGVGGSGMPMPQNPAMMNPPSYNEVVGNEGYQKQAPYNPNFSS